jgi:hypothetical protein
VNYSLSPDVGAVDDLRRLADLAEQLDLGLVEVELFYRAGQDVARRRGRSRRYCGRSKAADSS